MKHARDEGVCSACRAGFAYVARLQGLLGAEGTRSQRDRRFVRYQRYQHRLEAGKFHAHQPRAVMPYQTEASKILNRDLPVGTVLLWRGEPAVVRKPWGWQFVTGRDLGVNELDMLDDPELGYVVQPPPEAGIPGKECRWPTCVAAPDEAGILCGPTFTVACPRTGKPRAS